MGIYDPKEIKPREARQLAREFAYFARSSRRRALAAPTEELREAWKRNEREHVELALKYRKAWTTKQTLSLALWREPSKRFCRCATPCDFSRGIG